MSHLVRWRITLALLTVLSLAPERPASAADPNCAAPAVPASPAAFLEYCTNNGAAVCDLGMTAWDPLSRVSPDIRLGDAYSAGVERPRFLHDDAGDFYYTKIYSQLYNLETGPAPSSEVTIHFAVTTDVDAALVDPEHVSVTWQDIGTYQLHVPAAPFVLFPGPAPHQQQNAVCWNQDPGALFPGRFVLRAVLDWSEDGNSDNDTVYSLYDLRDLGRPAQIALALDLSGSMDAALGGSTRLTLARFRASQFTDLVEEGHQLGVYGFATDNGANTSFTTTYRDSANVEHERTLAETSVIAGIRTISNTADSTADEIRDQINLAIGGQTSHGCTPVGQALLRARQEILDSPFPEAGGVAPSKAIVLFSDGLQNVPPFVQEDSWSCHPGTAGPPIDPARTFAAEGFAVYSIYFGEEIDVGGAALMNEIKEQTGGSFVYGATDDLGLAVAYYAIRGLVDDIVYLEEAGTVSSLQASAPFTVEFDSAAGPATVTVAWPYDGGRTRLTMDRRRQGDAEWLPFEDSGTTGTTVQVPPRDPSPYRVFRFTPGPNTTWELRVRLLAPQQGSATFAAAVFSEVEELQIRPSLSAADFTAGDPLPIFAELASVGHPVLGAQVSAVVEVPTRPVSTTVRQYADRYTTATDPDTGRFTQITRQLKQFLRDDGLADTLYLAKEVAVTLRDDGSGADRVANDGTYSGELPESETRVAGRYGVTLSATAPLPSGRKASRIAKLATVANVGPADPRLSVVKVGKLSPLEDATSVGTIRILPTDRFGNAAFPGSGDLIEVTVDGRPVDGLVDNSDTIFTQEIAVPTGHGATVVVTVDGVTVGEVAVGRPEHQREWSLHLGAAIPNGQFSSLVSDGPAAGLDYAVLVDRDLAVRAELGFDWFDDAAGGSRLLRHLDVFLQYRRPSASRWTPYFEGGLGFYDLEGGSSGPGFALGVGAYYRLDRRWDLDFTARGHHVGGGLDLDFSQLLVGAIYKF